MDNIDFSKIYSFSKINLFSQCAKRYFFNYLDPEIAPRKKEYIKPRDYKTKGQAVHGAITLFYHLTPEKRTWDNIKNLLLESWFSEKDLSKNPPIGESGGFSSIEHERKSYEESLILLRNFLNFNDYNPSLFYMPTKNIKYSFDDYKEMIKPISNELFISGKFDRVDNMENGNLRVIDFKTSSDYSNPFQLEFYKLLAEINFNKKVDLVSFYYLDSKKIKNYDLSKVNSNDIKQKVLNYINNIAKAEKFPAKKTFICHHCDFKEICYD